MQHNNYCHFHLLLFICYLNLGINSSSYHMVLENKRYIKKATLSGKVRSVIGCSAYAFRHNFAFFSYSDNIGIPNCLLHSTDDGTDVDDWDMYKMIHLYDSP